MRLIFPSLIAIAAAAAPLLQGAVSFNRDIRPIMADTCFRCHGPDKNSRMANLRLDLREEATKPNRKGDVPIVPGRANASLVVKRIFSANQAMIMPPRAAHKELTAKQKETIRAWIDEGAVYEGHWSYQPVKRPAVPEVAGARTAIDAFIRQRLAAAGLTPSAEADRRTLLRRVTLDLTGLPPTPAEVEAFVADRSPDAYEKVVARLIDSDRYAEKQAMYWLDAVRYADTCGFHGDNAFPAWPYRDYVLRSLKNNKPFDQFTREQLAGDLMPDANDETRVASAFNRLTRTSAEGGLQPKEYLAKYAADRVRTLSSVWLGSTMGCAECHDHKFDPFPSRDFYSMKAFFADVKETGLVPDQGPKAWGELLMLPDAAQKAEWTALGDRIDAARKALDEKRTALGDAYEAWGKRLAAEVKDWVVQFPVAASSRNGAKLTLYKNEPVLSVFDFGGSVVNETKPANGLIVASGPNPDNETYTLTLKPGAGTWYSIGVEAISDDRLPGARLARGSDRLVVSDVEATVAGKPVRFSRARSNMTFWDAGLTPWNAIDGKPETGWGAATYRTFRTAFLALDLAEPLTTTAASTLTVSVKHDSDWRRAVTGRFRIALAASPLAQPIADRTQNPTIPGLSAEMKKAIETEPAKRSEQQADDVRALLDSTHADLAPLWNELSRLEGERATLRARIPQVVTTVAAPPEEIRVLPRGNFLDDSGAVVEPAVPQFFGKVTPVNGASRASRLDLANWLVSADNPLTARVYVNRLWRQLFGTGLSKQLEDLGSQGEWPTHPELIDWLAAEFVSPSSPGAATHAWDMKHIVRTIVLSDTYRQSSVPTREMIEKDPDNRLLARQARFRVEAESVRDIALAVSGLLTEKFGGPSVRPYQPEGYLAALNFPKRDYSESRGADLYRRGLYSFWQRTFLHPSLAAFDAPTREECTVNRTGSNTPLQSLVLLNDKTFVEAARVFAQNMIASGGKTFDARLDFAFARAVNRAPVAAERGILRGLYAKELARYRAAPKQAAALAAIGEAARPKAANPVELAATASVARAILNLHETITRN